ncbi:MAG: ATP-binding cassette domain-containing protein, partial [Pseudomonadota bacterium]|nr:ATP-binding cassette domain-containing protein [Pseudomonadota bacterium]
MTSERARTDPILSARDLNLSRDGVSLLKSVSLDITRGSVTFLLGYNGAGKTLLLSCLHGLIEQDSGQ